MSYAENILKDHVEVNYFVRFGVRFDFNPTWTLVSGTLYSTPYTGAPPDNLTWTNSGSSVIYRIVEAESLAEAISSPITGFDYKCMFYDVDAGLLYLDLSGIGSFLTLNDSDYEVVIEKLYFVSTKSSSMNQKPDDSSSRKVQYRGIIKNQISFTSSSSQIVFGFSPTYSSSLNLGDDGFYLLREVVDGSISNCILEIYRCAGEPTTENCLLCFRGLTKDIDFNGGNTTISYSDISLLLESDAASAIVPATADVNFAAATVRNFSCGIFNNLLCYNKNYSASVSTSNNRSWSFGQPFAFDSDFSPNLNHYIYTTDNANVGSNTSTRTYLDDVTGLVVGDWILKNGGTTVSIVTAVGVGYIDHSSVTTLTVDDFFEKTQYKTIYIMEIGGSYLPADFYTVPYSEIQSFSKDGFIFKSTLESAISLPSTLTSDTHIVFVQRLDVSLGRFNFPSTGAPLGFTDVRSFNGNPVQAIYELLYVAGFYDKAENYDTDSFESVASEIENTVIDFSGLGVYFPVELNSYSSPKFKDIISKICETFMIKLFMKNGKWKVQLINKLGSTTYSGNQDNILVNNSYRRLSEDIARTQKVTYSPSDFLVNPYIVSPGDKKSKDYTNDNISILNLNKRTTTRSVYLDNTGDARDTAETILFRYSAIFSSPLGFLEAEFDRSFFDIDLADVVEIDPEGIDYLPFDSPKKFSVTSVIEKEDSVVVQLFDQDGIEKSDGSIWL